MRGVSAVVGVSRVTCEQRGAGGGAHRGGGVEGAQPHRGGGQPGHVARGTSAVSSVCSALHLSMLGVLEVGWPDTERSPQPRSSASSSTTLGPAPCPAPCSALPSGGRFCQHPQILSYCHHHSTRRGWAGLLLPQFSVDWK